MAEITEASSGKTEIPEALLKHVANTFKVGADPEFVVLNKTVGCVLNATPYATTVNVIAGGIGQDHGGRVWELRPSPSYSTYQVVTNIWKLLNSKSLDKIAQFRWKAGGLSRDWPGTGQFDDDTIGGHVHFGLTALAPSQLKALSDMTTLLEKLDILPTHESRIRDEVAARLGRDFGKTGTRPVPGHGSPHVEYRAPASWLDCPGQALACLTALKLAVVAPSATVLGLGSRMRFLDWLNAWSAKDADAWLTIRLIEKQGFKVVQASPEEDFKPKWRKEELWH